MQILITKLIISTGIILELASLQSYEKDQASVTDKDNKMFLKFSHGLDTQGLDMHAQPGGDLAFYLQDLQSRATTG